MVQKLNLQFNGELKLRDKTEYIVLHHSGVSTPHTAEDIHCWHQKKGWAGIGYHYFISKDGEIFQCRPRETVGAHAKGYNQNSIGVCFEGNFYKESMTDKQISLEVAEFLFFLRVHYYMDNCEIVFCDELEKRSIPTIKGFRKKELWYGINLNGGPDDYDRIPEAEWDDYVNSFIDGE